MNATVFLKAAELTPEIMATTTPGDTGTQLVRLTPLGESAVFVRGSADDFEALAASLTAVAADIRGLAAQHADTWDALGERAERADAHHDHRPAA